MAPRISKVIRITKAITVLQAFLNQQRAAKPEFDGDVCA
jgi:hypothetical protein